MSSTETNPGSQALTTIYGGFTCCDLQAIPHEVLILVMEHLPDMAALSRLFTAYPMTLIHFRLHGHKILASILDRMSPELRHSALDVLAVQSRPPIGPSRITHFIKHHLNAEVCYSQACLRRYKLSALLDLITVAESIESLTQSFAHARILSPCMQHSMPLSQIELHRIQRSFWRFQLCYDMCHPEDTTFCRKSCDVKSRSTRRYVHYQTGQPISRSVPNWLQCRGEAYCPEALSRFLPNLCRWELDELEAVRFHLARQINTLQYHRSSGSEDTLIPQPVLLQRLIRDIDDWDTGSAEDHVLVASFSQTSYAHQYPIVWDRVRECYAASTPNTTYRLAMRAWQAGHPQWGWCLWDEQRLIDRGMIDVEFEKWVADPHRMIVPGPQIDQRRWSIDRAHWECIAAQYTVLDRRVVPQYALDAQMQAVRRA